MLPQNRVLLPHNVNLTRTFSQSQSRSCAVLTSFCDGAVACDGLCLGEQAQRPGSVQIRVRDLHLERQLCWLRLLVPFQPLRWLWLGRGGVLAAAAWILSILFDAELKRDLGFLRYVPNSLLNATL